MSKASKTQRSVWYRDKVIQKLPERTEFRPQSGSLHPKYEVPMSDV